jgi:hypothetical protein
MEFAHLMLHKELVNGAPVLPLCLMPLSCKNIRIPMGVPGITAQHPKVRAPCPEEHAPKYVAIYPGMEYHKDMRLFKT